jgi:hypothetical protein
MEQLRATTIVAEAQRLGRLPKHFQVKGGWLISRVSGQRITTPDETDVYRELGLQYVHPWLRT